MGQKTPKNNKLAKKLRKQRHKMTFKAEISMSLQLYNSGKMQAAERVSADVRN